ncbi:hypothetical protein HYR99_30330, partial [Candidatus Poribacteria bacterium]|nr:hypothetical protein [Candidatus Poribacteria bacterium]
MIRGNDQPRKNFTFNQPGDFTIRVRAVDTDGVPSAVLDIPSRAWTPPEVLDTPLPDASFLSGKYVGVKGQPVKLGATGQTKNNDPNEQIVEFRWDPDKDSAFGESGEIQTVGQILSYTWTSSSLSDIIKCRAVTNYDIQSQEKPFSLKIYDTVQASPAGPYTGRPNQPVTLKGSINTTSYPGATVAYQWKVQQTSGGALVAVTTKNDGSAENTWTADGVYNAEFTATVTTAEGLSISGSGTTTVVIESGRPTAMPGGPYRGGIDGGNFTPIQFAGNPPDFVEAADIGKIVAWEWFNGEVLNVNGTLKGQAVILETGDIELTPAQTNKNGQFEYSNLPLGESWEVTGDFWSGGGTGADAFYIYVWANSTPASEGANAGQYSINYDEFDDQIQLNYAGVPLATVAQSGIDNSQWRPFQVRVQKGVFRVYLDNQLKLEYDDSANYKNRMSNSLFGFGARTGGLTNFHRVRNMIWIPILDVGGPLANVWNPTQAFPKAGTYPLSLRVRSEFGKWSSVATTKVTVVDGKIQGFVRAADLRTPVKGVQLTLTSSHVDPDVLARIASEDPRLNTTGDDGLSTETDEKGFYAFEHLPLGSYRIVASKVDGNTIHEFETPVKATELTLDAPNQLAIDLVDLSVFPVGGRVVYSIQKNGVDVLADGVVVEAQAPLNANTLKAVPTTKSLSPAGTNYSLPLFAGKYLFIATRAERDIRIKATTPGYNPDTGLVTIEAARTDIDFIDYTTRQLTVFVVDSGGFKMPGRPITVSGENGQAEGASDDPEGKFVVALNPGR